MAKKGHNPRSLGIGRQKGTLNKKTEALHEICERKGINPFEALLEMAQHDDPNIRLGALKEVCAYLYPKRKALEISTSDEGFKIIIEDYMTKPKTIEVK